MPDENTLRFPDDLFNARRELHEVHAELRAFPVDRPWSLEPNDGWDEPERWYPSARPATEGWTDDDVHAYTALQKRARELSKSVITHTFWATIDAAERSDARSRLIDASRPASCEPDPELVG